ncbi:sulfotransferase family 2 domain-containing protein [bacterium]|nr:sulfotransferase family 2 domain-containing protein [bacterium]
MNKPFFFLHIPKTAGTTLRHCLKLKYRADEIFFIDNSTKNKSIKEGLVNLSPNEKEKLKMVIGHGYFGMHNCFNKHKEYPYLSLLREPSSRVISLFNQAVNSKYENEIGEFIIKNNASIEDVINTNKYRGFNNDQCRLIANLPFEKSITDVELYEAALYNIEKHFKFIGLQEHFNLSLLMLKELLEWKTPPFYLKLNQSSKKEKSIITHSKEDKDAIISANQADIKLYDYVKLKFDKKYEENKKHFDSILRQHSITNKMFQYAGTNYLRLKRKLGYPVNPI